MDTFECTVLVPTGRKQFVTLFDRYVDKFRIRKVLIDRNTAKQAKEAAERYGRVIAVGKFHDADVFEYPLKKLQAELPLRPSHAAMQMDFIWQKQRKKRENLYKDKLES